MEIGIVQMMPADHWYACYTWHVAPYYRLEPLVAWVLVEPPGEPHNRWICGFEAGGMMQPPHVTDEEADHFLEYVHEMHVTPTNQALWAEASQATSPLGSA